MESSTLVISITPIKGRPEHFEARLGDRVLCKATRQPLLDGARRLLQLGYEPGATIVMRDPDSSTDRLRASIATAAKWTVAEGDHDAPRFRRWKAPQCREGSPPAAPLDLPATSRPANVVSLPAAKSWRAPDLLAQLPIVARARA